MSLLLAVGGWCAALAVAAAAGILWRRHRCRMELVARACHEARTPLTTARLGVEALARIPARPSARRIRAVDLELRRATLALDDLDAARSGSRVADRSGAVELDTLLCEVADAWRPAARARGRELRCVGARGVPAVRGDRLRLAQALGTLLSNAVEHGDGPVELRARPAGGAVRIEVADRGPGLPDPLGVLARRRPRAGRHRRGRGLAIAEEIVRRHGGRLMARTDRGGGACLAVDLPSGAVSDPPPAVRGAS